MFVLPTKLCTFGPNELKSYKSASPLSPNKTKSYLLCLFLRSSIRDLKFFDGQTFGVIPPFAAPT